MRGPLVRLSLLGSLLFIYVTSLTSSDKYNISPSTSLTQSERLVTFWRVFRLGTRSGVRILSKSETKVTQEDLTGEPDAVSCYWTVEGETGEWCDLQAGVIALESR